MTVSRQPPALSSSPRNEQNLSSLSRDAAFQPPTSQALRPQQLSHRSPSLPVSRPSYQHPSRAQTSPTNPDAYSNMRPAYNQGPASHSGHSSSSHSSAIQQSQQHKSYSAHGHGSSNGQQGSYFGPGSSGGTTGNGGNAITAGTSRSYGSRSGGHGDDDDVPLNSPNPPFAGSSTSRPSSPRSNQSHSDDSHRYGSSLQHSQLPYAGPSSLSNQSSSSVSGPSTGTATLANTSTTTLSAPSSAAPCSACHQPMSGQFVRALGTVFHLDCFRCGDCNAVVASKFFPIERPDGKQQPLCERDYFRRLNLICAKCEQALRGSYITACNKKYHVEHFTCSVCPALFGPQDSYYEHNGDVYCHFHYSTRFATKCVGCNSAILKQFVEINRNMRDECWHPECYMIHKFWNVKVASRPTSSIPVIEGKPWEEEESQFTAIGLKEKQSKMETLVYRIWTHLSAFEESSAACISDMLRHVSSGTYLDAIRMAEKFILHVEVLFAAIDELEAGFARASAKGMSHVREARMLCRKTVDLFTLLSHTQDSSNPSAASSHRMGMTQELLALVTGLAHYLKILIRIALTGALKLEREYSNGDALLKFLDRLQYLALDGADPLARRTQNSTAAKQPSVRDAADPSPITPQNLHQLSGATAVDYSEGVAYGYRSLSPDCAGESPFSPKAIGQAAAKGTSSVQTPPSDLCAACKLTVEEDCVRLGTYQRWHSHCVKCATCGKVAAAYVPPPPKVEENGTSESANGGGKPSKISSARRPPANVDDFRYETLSGDNAGSSDRNGPKVVIYCVEHTNPNCRSGFSAVSRLEQYAFLLNVALRRLYLLLHKRGVMPLASASPSSPTSARGESPTNSYRDSGDILRMKSSVHLDRKLSATARLPKRSTIVESPTGKIAQPTATFGHQAQVHAPDQSALSQRPAQAGTIGSSQRSQANYGRPNNGPPPRPPPPNIPPLNQHDSTPGQSPVSSYPPSNIPAPSGQTQDAHAIRPAFARNNTQVLVIDDRTPELLPSESTQTPRIDPNVPRNAGYEMEPTSSREGPASYEDDEGLTLADIPQLLESEQAREQHRSLPRMAGKPMLADLSPLELAIIKHFAVIVLQRSPLRDQFDLDEILELIEVKKNTFWNKLFKGNDKKGVKKKGVFGVPLELLAEQGTDSMLGASRSPLRVPIFIDDVISAMKQMDMSVEGIFRRNGNIRRLKELTDAIDRDAASVDLTQENPVQLAALMKKFFRDLPDPLMTYKLHKLWNAIATLPLEEDRRRYLHILCVILPKAHRDTLEALFVFLKWVASFSHVDEETGSKMDLGNLATVIAPSILYAKNRDATREDSFTAIPVVTELLERQDEFYCVPDEFLGVLHDQDYFSNCLDMPCKDVLKKADTYLRLKQAGRSPIPPQNGYGNGPSNNGDGRLVNQRSDPAMSRGRPAGGDGLRSPPPLRIPNASRSRERKYANDPQSNPNARIPPHPGIPQQMPSPAGPPSPRQQRYDAGPWPSTQPTTPAVPPGWSGPGSRPTSFIRPNGEHGANGRQSPAGRY